MADDEGFVRARIERDGAPAEFGAGAYSFFGDLGGADDELGGALEEGLEAPPEEELPDPDLMLDEEEDLSYASMFAAALGSPAKPDASPQARPQQEQRAAAEVQAEAPASADRLGSGSLFQDFDVGAAGGPGPTPPPRLKPGSIALGGLLAAGTPGSPFGSAPGSAPFGAAFAQQPSPLGQPSDAGGLGQLGQPPVIASLPGAPLGGPMAPRALTAQELEAQLLSGNAGGQAPQPPQQQPGPMPFPGLQQPGMPPPPGYMGGMPPLQHNGFPPPHHMPPPGYSPPPPHHMQQGPPPPGYGPPPHHMGGPPPGPQFSPGAAFPPMHGRPPPRGPIPMQQLDGFQGPPHGMPPPHGPPPGYGPGPGPRGPPPPGYGPPHMRPGPGMAPPGGPGGFGPRGPPPGPWGPRPNMGPPPHGMAPQRPQQLQHATLAQRLRALDLADRHEEGYRRPMLRRRYFSQYMDADDIEHILYMQWRPLHQGSPYLEDYYYQAFLYKYYAKRNRRFFAPETVRELAPTEKMAADEVAFVKVEGLGRLPFSNIRRPRALLDVAPEDLRKDVTAQEGEPQSEGKGGEDGAPARPLDQEPLLAARIMIEDCMCLLLDVLDIDQIFVATAGGPVENECALRTRRALLMEGLAASLRLPETAVAAPAPAGGAAAAGGEAAGDGVFLRLMSLYKGKRLLARALGVVYPAPEAAAPRRSALVEGELPAVPQHPNLRIVWAALRHLRYLFAGKPGNAEDAAVSAAVATALAEVLRRLHSPDAVADCLAAVLAGDLDGAPLMDAQPDAVLMPLYAPGANAHDTQRPWLNDVLMALLQRAAELDLLPATVPEEAAAAAAAAWRRQLPLLYALVERHVSALHEAFQAGMAMGEKEAAAEIKQLMPIFLVRVLGPHCTPQQVAHLRGKIADLGV